MNIPQITFLVAILLGGFWGFSVGYPNGRAFGPIGAIIGGMGGLVCAVMVVASWAVVMERWERSKLHHVLPEVASRLIMIILSLLALAGVGLFIGWLIKGALRHRPV